MQHMGSICDEISYCQVKKLMILAISGERPVLKKDKEQSDSPNGSDGATSGPGGTTSGSSSKNVSTFRTEVYTLIYYNIDIFQFLKFLDIPKMSMPKTIIFTIN